MRERRSRHGREDEVPVPLLDLGRAEEPIREELLAAVRRVAESSSFVLGPVVRSFEEAMASDLGVRHAIGVANGTDALYLALRALDLEPGDEVITTPFTFFATAGAIANAGGRVVFADIDPRTFNIDPRAAEHALSSRTRAILPVHLFGQVADMQPLNALAESNGIPIIEDAAQAVGAKALVEGKWRPAGSLGTVACFSFYPTKNLGGWGDGGLITTDDDRLAAHMRRLREHGQERGADSYRHAEVGINSRLDAIQAAVLETKLPHLSGWTESRRANAAGYDERLAGVPGVQTPTARPDRFHVYHQYTIRAEQRDGLRAHLEERAIGSGIYYPVPLHLQPCFADLGYGRGEFPEAEAAAGEVLSLPVFPGLRPAERERVVSAIREYYGG